MWIRENRSLMLKATVPELLLLLAMVALAGRIACDTKLVRATGCAELTVLAAAALPWIRGRRYNPQPSVCCCSSVGRATDS